MTTIHCYLSLYLCICFSFAWVLFCFHENKQSIKSNKTVWGSKQIRNKNSDNLKHKTNNNVCFVFFCLQTCVSFWEKEKIFKKIKKIQIFFFNTKLWNITHTKINDANIFVLFFLTHFIVILCVLST